MKLLTKLTLFITLSKVMIVVLFVSMLPSLVNRVSVKYTDHYLREQQNKVTQVIKKNGLDDYLQGDTAYGSYTMLKEEYIAITPQHHLLVDTIMTTQRVVDADTLTYRVLAHSFNYSNKGYVLEVGKTTATIGQYNTLLQRFALFVLAALIVVSIVLDLVYTRVLLKPLYKIVSTKLLNRQFPFKEPLVPIATSTSDFQYLDRSLISLMERIQVAFDKEKEFTSNASHELMTPITILQSSMENIMMRENLSEDLQEKILANMKTLGRLKKIVHSLLYISRIENDQFAKTATVNLYWVIQEVTEELEARAQMRGIRIKNNVSPEANLHSVNAELIFQLFYNLMTNAIRYNVDDGSIDVSDQAGPGSMVTVVLRDTGIGINTEDLPGIFDRFRKSGPNKIEGHGLGLSIVQSIAFFHGATIQVRSTPGTGTSFGIRFAPANVFPK